MRYHLFQKVFRKIIKIKETSFLLSVSSQSHATVSCCSTLNRYSCLEKWQFTSYAGLCWFSMEQHCKKGGFKILEKPLYVNLVYGWSLMVKLVTKCIRWHFFFKTKRKINFFLHRRWLHFCVWNRKFTYPIHAEHKNFEGRGGFV